MAWNITSTLFGLARASAWTRAVSKAAQGNPKPLLRRVRNRYILGQLGQVLRK